MPEIGVFTMVVLIVLIVSITRVMQAKYGYRRGSRHDQLQQIQDDPQLRLENDRLRDEMRGLKERVAVLERIATDTNRSVDLDREIEKLRDR